VTGDNRTHSLEKAKRMDEISKARQALLEIRKRDEGYKALNNFKDEFKKRLDSSPDMRKLLLEQADILNISHDKILEGPTNHRPQEEYYRGIFELCIQHCSNKYELPELEKVSFDYVTSHYANAFTVYSSLDNSYAIGMDHAIIYLLKHVLPTMLGTTANFMKEPLNNQIGPILDIYDMVCLHYSLGRLPDMNKRMLNNSRYVASLEKEHHDIIQTISEGMFAFFIMHEIAHIVLGHLKRKTPNRSAPDDLNLTEFSADEWAAKELIEIPAFRQLGPGSSLTTCRLMSIVELALPEKFSANNILQSNHPSWYDRSERLESLELVGSSEVFIVMTVWLKTMREQSIVKELGLSARNILFGNSVDSESEEPDSQLRIMIQGNIDESVVLKSFDMVEDKHISLDVGEVINIRQFLSPDDLALAAVISGIISALNALFISLTVHKNSKSWTNQRFNEKITDVARENGTVAYEIISTNGYENLKKMKKSPCVVEIRDKRTYAKYKIYLFIDGDTGIIRVD